MKHIILFLTVFFVPYFTHIGLLASSSHPQGERNSSPKTSGNPIYDHQARVALKSIGIDREPISVEFRIMSIDRLFVVVPSLNEDVENLHLVFWKMETGKWTLEGWTPTQENIQKWLKESSAKGEK